MQAPGPRLATRLALAATTLALLAACGGGTPTGGPGATSAATGAPVTDLTKLCDLLGPGDFAAAGIAGAGTPTVNTDGPGSAYCVYAGKSAATGGIEFDVFVDEDAAGTYQTILDEAGGTLDSIPIPGVDAAVGREGTAGQADGFATVVVRKGNLVFTIGVPGGAGASAKLVALAGVVLARGAGLLG